MELKTAPFILFLKSLMMISRLSDAIKLKTLDWDSAFFDLSIAIDCLHEMKKIQVEWYFDEFDRLSKNDS